MRFAIAVLGTEVLAVELGAPDQDEDEDQAQEVAARRRRLRLPFGFTITRGTPGKD